MTATTLGDLFPQLNNCRPQKPPRNRKAKRNTGPATALRLKKLYPELDSWDPFYVTAAWLHWGDSCGIELREPEERDEQFLVYLAKFIHAKMLELETTLKTQKRQAKRFDAVFRQLAEAN